MVFLGSGAQHGAARLFDVYAHHPYVPAGDANTLPAQAPCFPATTVTIGNLSTLLRIFPGKPFYLSEYGFNTLPSLDYGRFAVSEAQQARDLKSAYAVAGRYPQVKALFWFLAQDVRPAAASAAHGVYTGLQRLDGSRKPSWYAFARIGAAQTK